MQGRYIDNAERARLSGVLWDSIKDLGSEREHRCSLGNIIHVDFAGVALAPIMAKWKLFEGKLMQLGVKMLRSVPPPEDEEPLMV